MAFGLFEGPSSGEQGATNALTGLSGFAGTVGEGLAGNDAAFLNALLSGNEAEISKLLAPQISGVQKRANESTQTRAQFANRSGGTNAFNQNTMDQARGNVNDMISNLTSGAVSSAGSLGSNLLGQGMSGQEAVFGQQQKMQNQRANQWNDIFGSALGAGSMLTGGLAGVANSPAGANQGLAFLSGMFGG